MNIVVTGGCGYVGSVLVPKLLDAGHHVCVVDLQWFGDRLVPHVNLDVVKNDIQKVGLFGGCDAVIHMAAVANDPAAELDPRLTWETNVLGTLKLASEAAAISGGMHFIYASSGSVYGVSDAPEVTERSALCPISDYNKTKMVAEHCVTACADGYAMAVDIVRPATVCGYSPRMRLDVVVNMLTMQALTKGVITVLGGNQYRPNIHIEDMADLYLWLLERRSGGIWNAGFENMTVYEISGLVAEQTGARIIRKESNDPRSYRMNSDKLLAAGFKPKRTVKQAISEIVAKFKAGELADTDDCYNIRQMRIAA